MNTTKTPTLQSMYPVFRYNDAPGAIEWLKAAFGFEEHVVYRDDSGGIAHAELSLNGNLIMLGASKDGYSERSPATLGAATGGLYIAFETPGEIDALHARAKAAGAMIVRDLCDTDYGSREFGARDLEGYAWSFGTHRPQAGSSET